MRKYLEHFTGKKIPENEWKLLSDIVEKTSLGKGELLLAEGKTCHKIWFLKEGAVRLYENVDGEHRTTHFFLPPAMFTVYHSLITGLPSELSIAVVEDVVLEVLPFEKLKKLYDESPFLERIGRIMAENQFVSEFNRRRMLLNMNALERYEFLESNQPEVFQHFHLKDIATYLGITPVSLSRLRKLRMERK